ncbi:hypothetical protein Tco_0715119 [Tanacetum coccineum]
MVVLEQETDKMVEGDGGDLGILDKLIVELGTRLDQGSHKERLDDDDDDLDNGRDPEDLDKRKGSLESRVQKKQTPIATPSRSPRTDDVTDSLNESIPEATLTSLVGAQKLVNSPVIDQQGSSEILDSEVIPTKCSKVVEHAPLGHTSEGLIWRTSLVVQTQITTIVSGSELTDKVVHMSGIPTHSSSQRVRHLRGVVARVTKHINRMTKTMKKRFVHRRDAQNLCEQISHTINVEVPPLVKEGTIKVVKANIRRAVHLELKDEVNNFKDDLRSLVTQELATTAPQQIEEFLRNYMQNHAITLQPPSRIPIPELQQKLYTEMKGSPESQATDLEMWVVLKENFESSSVLPNTCRQMVFRKRDHDDHSDDPREGEKNAKKKKTFKGSTSANVTTTSSKQHVQIF